MSTFTVPNTFIPGTKAKAEEVNANFSELCSHLETLNTSLNTKSNASETPVNILTGLTLSFDNDTNQLTIQKGYTNDSTDTKLLKLSSAIKKVFSSNFVPGTGNNGLDTGTVAASSQYYVFLISQEGDDTDVLISLSKTPTLPNNYVYYKRIGNFVTNGSSQVEAVYPSQNIIHKVQTEHFGHFALPAFFSGYEVKKWDTIHYANYNTWLNIQFGIYTNVSFALNVGNTSSTVNMQVINASNADTASIFNKIFIPIPKGTYYKCSGGGSSVQILAFKCNEV